MQSRRERNLAGGPVSHRTPLLGRLRLSGTARARRVRGEPRDCTTVDEIEPAKPFGRQSPAPDVGPDRLDVESGRGSGFGCCK